MKRSIFSHFPYQFFGLLMLFAYLSYYEECCNEYEYVH